MPVASAGRETGDAHLNRPIRRDIILRAKRAVKPDTEKGFDLPDPKQRASEATGAGLFLTNEAARAALPVAPLSLEVVNLLSEIEPDNRVARTMTLRLRFIPKRSERQSSGSRRHNDRRHK